MSPFCINLWRATSETDWILLLKSSPARAIAADRALESRDCLRVRPAGFMTPVGGEARDLRTIVRGEDIELRTPEANASGRPFGGLAEDSLLTLER